MKDHTADLDAYLRASFGKRYQPGEHDCVLFIAGWADHVSGSSHAEGLRGSYQTHNQGLRKHVGQGSSISLKVRDHLLAAGWHLIPGAPRLAKDCSQSGPTSGRGHRPEGAGGAPESISRPAPQTPPADSAAFHSEFNVGRSMFDVPPPFQTGDIILTDGDHPGIWRGKSIVATAFGFAGHAYIHRRHATAALRWPSPLSPPST
jgi:hypothetical protein